MENLVNLERKKANDLVELQKTLYSSKNYTRRRLHLQRFEWVRRAIESCAPFFANSSAIEYGPGSGIYLPILASHYSQLIAADIEKAYLDDIEGLKKSLPNLETVIDDLQESQLGRNKFNLVLCTEVLEHVPNPELAMQTIFNILEPGGIAIITTPQKFSIMELSCKIAFLPGILNLVRGVYKEPIFELGHISLRSAGQMKNAIKRNSFEVLKAEKLGLYIPLLAEFAGLTGGQLIESLESAIKNTPLNGLLWTQAYVLRKPS